MSVIYSAGETKRRAGVYRRQTNIGYKGSLFGPPNQTEKDEPAPGDRLLNNIPLKDQNTGAVYILYVSDGKLTMDRGEPDASTYEKFLLRDQNAETSYKLCVSSGELTMGKTIDSPAYERILFDDKTTTTNYKLYVSDGKLAMEEYKESEE